MSATVFWTVKMDTAGIGPVWGLEESEAKRKRRVSVETMNVLEMLGHAIEYLTDDSISDGKSFKLSDPRIQAATLLMQKSREIYFECPAVPTVVERFRMLFGRAA